MNIRFVSALPQYMSDVPEVLRAFFPYIKEDADAENYIELRVSFENNNYTAQIFSSLGEPVIENFIVDTQDTLIFKRLTKRFVKTALYKYLSSLTNISLPYGSLTGVRPTRPFYELMEAGEDAEKYLIEHFFVAPEKAKLIAEVVDGQKGIYKKDPKRVDIFVNIPFCPTRCGYCSFISTEIGRIKKYIPRYIDCVVRELHQIKAKIAKDNLTLKSIYVGGGTPTSLSADELEKILNPLAGYGVEFTVEAGRPDSIDSDKLKVFNDLGVTRISINPQTFNPQTLQRIGRTHTLEDISQAFELARKYPFDINADLIAGLPEESLKDFEDTLKKTLALKPENITIHTLSIKRGAEIKNAGAEKSVSGIAREMTDLAREGLALAGYRPYYMYRQKRSSDNLENTGYALNGKQCVYNINFMEELTTVFGAGAGAMSKYVFHGENRIERHANPKGLEDYLKRFEKG